MRPLVTTLSNTQMQLTYHVLVPDNKLDKAANLFDDARVDGKVERRVLGVVLGIERLLDHWRLVSQPRERDDDIAARNPSEEICAATVNSRVALAVRVCRREVFAAHNLHSEYNGWLLVRQRLDLRSAGPATMASEPCAQRPAQLLARRAHWARRAHFTRRRRCRGLRILVDGLVLVLERVRDMDAVAKRFES